MHLVFWRMAFSDTFISCAVALLLDFCIGDPPNWPHPVRGIGWLIARLESVLYRRRHRFVSGCVLVFVAVLGVCSCAYLLLLVSSYFGRYAQIGIAAALIWATIAVRDLSDHAERVRLALEHGDLEKARLKLANMVSRETAGLNENKIARGCVESVAENLVDGVISPLFFALLGGPVLACAFKTISTLDSMVGYRNERYQQFGWASARTDDVLNYVPARLLFVTLPMAALISSKRAVACFKIMWRDGGKNPSPNSGIPEAGFAGALGIQLGGPNTYAGAVIFKPLLNEADRTATVYDIRSAQLLLFSASVITFCVLVGLRLLFAHTFFSEVAQNRLIGG